MEPQLLLQPLQGKLALVTGPWQGSRESSQSPRSCLVASGFTNTRVPPVGQQGDLVPAEGWARSKAHLVASVPQVPQGQALALGMEETDQSLQQGKKTRCQRASLC